MVVSAGVPFLHAVGTGFTVCQQDLTELVRLEDAQALSVPEDLKGDAGHEFHAAPLIFNDPQAGQLLVDNGGGGFLTGHYGYGLYRVRIRHPAVNTRQLPDLPAAGDQLVKDDDAIAGLAGAGLASLDVLDLDGDAGEGVAGVAPLLHPQGAVGGVPEGQGGCLVILHIGVLGALLRQQVIPGRDLLGYGIVALQGQGDGHGPVRAGGEGTDFLSLRVIDREHGPFQGDLGPFLQLHDLQGRLVRIRFPTVCIAADGGHIQLYLVVQVTDVIL